MALTTKRLASGSPRVVLEVTESILEAAKVRDSGHCMLAEALKAAVPTASRVSVDLATIRFTDIARGRRYVYLTPRVAQEALVDFDQGEAMEPFSVILSRAAMVVAVRNKRGKVKGKAPGSGEPPPDQPEVRRSPENSDGVPVVVGGKAPPIGPLSNVRPSRRTGRIRAYGLRALKR